MKPRFRQELRNDMRNLLNRIWCFRFITFIIMLFFFMDIFLSPFRANVRLMGQDGNIFILPFLQTSDYYMKVVFIGVVYFYSNVPFMEKAELFYLIRLGKERWGRRNIFYIWGSSFILAFCFLAVSIMELFSAGNISLSWGSVCKTISLTGGRDMLFRIPYSVMREYEPLFLMTLILFLDTLVIALIGLLMYAVSLHGHRLLACVAALMVVFLSAIDAWSGGRLAYYSPVSWLNCSNWRIGYDNTRPDLPYILVAAVFLDVLLVVICQIKIKKMEWKTVDD